MSIEALLLPLRGEVVLPGTIRALLVARPSSLATLRAHFDAKTPLVSVPQLDPDEEDGATAGLLGVGTLLRMLQATTSPDGTIRLLVEGIDRVSITKQQTVDNTLRKARVTPLPPAEDDPATLTGTAMEAARLYKETVVNSGMGHEDAELLTAPADHPDRLADYIGSVSELSWEQRLRIQATPSVVARLSLLIDHLAGLLVQQRLEQDVSDKVQALMDGNQREYHLKEQLKVLRKELGSAGPEDDADMFEERIKEAKLPEAALKEATREIARLRRVPTDSAEFNIIRTWLETLCEVPWSTSSIDETNLPHAKEVLDEDHFGLKVIKDRLLEYLAVRQLRPDGKGAILCFAGAPGVGKTSLGRSIARAMGRSFARVSLGGIKDESEIRGHRRTYVGALPGRIVRALIRAGTNNPVIVLDEIDKVGGDVRGDPASALLEVLDPEQNHAFSDHYLDVDVDLSKVLFIATANLVDTIPSALLDRFEVIELPGYTEEEKVQIARRHLMPRLATEHGMTAGQVKLSASTLSHIVQHYTREAGLRNLNRQLASIYRKVAREIVEGRRKGARVSPQQVKRYLGVETFTRDIDDRDAQPGVVIGLAWTPTGGDILFLEALAMEGTAGLKLTGSLGNVMKESAEAAMSWLRANAGAYGLDKESFNQSLHLHVPAGAIPKDGPSAGISMLTTLASLLTGRPVHPKLAMTGELTLRGKVLAVGGVKEKVLAARRAGVTTIILPKDNAKDLEDIPAEVRRDLTFHPVERVTEVLELALSPKP